MAVALLVTAVAWGVLGVAASGAAALPTLVETPTNGRPGDALTLSAYSFFCTSTMTFTFGKTTLGSEKQANPTVLRTTVPTMAPGDYTVEAECLNAAGAPEGATNTFQIDPPPPSLTASPTNGPAGTPLTLSAYDFTYGLPCLSSITFAFDGSTIGSAAVANPAVLTTTVPSLAPATYRAEASCTIDANLPKSAFTDFTVDPTPPPTTTTSTTTTTTTAPPPTTTTTTRPVRTTTGGHATTTTSTSTTTTTTITTAPTAPTTTTTTAAPPPTRVLTLNESTVQPGGSVGALGRGCDPETPVVVTVGQRVVARTVASSTGTFTASLAFASLRVGRHQVVAQCGPTLTASFDVVDSSAVGQPTGTLAVIIIFLLFGTILLVRSIRRSPAPRPPTGDLPDDEAP